MQAEIIETILLAGCAAMFGFILHECRRTHHFRELRAVLKDVRHHISELRHWRHNHSVNPGIGRHH
jgi:hypothetical protein